MHRYETTLNEWSSHMGKNASSNACPLWRGKLFVHLRGRVCSVEIATDEVGWWFGVTSVGACVFGKGPE
eukprot:232392-Pyramimonas_sp.AAC.1